MGTSGNSDSGGRRGTRWWDARLLVRWTLVNAGACVIIVVGGVLLEEGFAGATREIASVGWWLATVAVALIGAGFHGFVLGRWQWRVVHERLPGLGRRRWVVATFAPAFAVWLLLLAPQAVGVLVAGGKSVAVLRDAFVQVLVLGPLIGVSQALALRRSTRRWAWWILANVSTYLVGAVLYVLGKAVLDAFSVSTRVSPAIVVPVFVFHGLWMLWVTAPTALTTGKS